jgi:hypothetical protein
MKPVIGGPIATPALGGEVELQVAVAPIDGT